MTRLILILALGALSPTVTLADRYTLPTDLVIESDCDVDTTTETVAINLPDAL